MKTTKFNHSTSFNPPAPVIDVLLLRPLSKESTNGIRVSALIDSGADITAVPQAMVNRLQLYPVDEILVAGYTGETIRELVYSVAIVIANLKPQIVKAVGYRSDDIALIGRDLINQWLLVLDGKQQVFEISVND
jgi:predicted aspartyl protease